MKPKAIGIKDFIKLNFKRQQDGVNIEDLVGFFFAFPTKSALELVSGF